MKKLKKYLKKILAGGVALVASFALLGAGSVSAETSNTIQSPNISTNQGLGGAAANKANDSSQVANQVGDHIGNKADQTAGNIVKANREFANNNAGSAIESVENIAGNVRNSANNAAGDGVSYTNIPSVDGFKNRVNNVIDEGGTTVLGWLIRIVYYATFWGMMFGFIASVISLFVKKMSTWKYLSGAILSLIIFYGCMSFLGVSISATNNPIVDLISYLFHG